MNKKHLVTQHGGVLSITQVQFTLVVVWQRMRELMTKEDIQTILKLQLVT